MKTIFSLFSALVTFVLLVGGALLYSSFAWGFVFFKLFSWFVLPVFSTLPAVTFHQSVGLMFFVGLFKSSEASDLYLNDTKIEKKPNLWITLALPWLLLGVAFFVKLFI